MSQPMFQQKFRYPVSVRARVRDLTQGGAGIARLESADPALDGRIVFVEAAVPGDLLEINMEQLTEGSSSGKKGSLSPGDYRLLQASADRQPAFCPVFGRCGGCQLQELPYAASLAWKEKRLHRLLEKNRQAALFLPILGMADPYHYRARARLRCGLADGQPRLAFQAAHSHHLVPCSPCALLTPQLEALRGHLETILAEKLSPAEIEEIEEIELRAYSEQYPAQIIVHCAEDAPLFSPRQHAFWQAVAGLGVSLWAGRGKKALQHLAGPEKLQLKEHDLTLAYSPQAFIQTNIRQNTVLYDAVIAAVRRFLEENKQAARPLRILELYCGSGSISLVLAQTFPQLAIRGIEIVPEAIADARANANAAAFTADRLHFAAGNAEKALRGKEGSPCQLLLVDPPRAGLGRALCSQILAK